MVVNLDAHQTTLEPFGLPWSSCHARHPDEGPSLGNSSRSRYFRISASAPSSPPSVFEVLKASGGGNGSGNDGSNAGGRKTGLAKIQIELQPCRPQTAPSPPPSEADRPRPKPKKSNSAPVVLQQSECPISSQGKAEASESSKALPSCKVDTAHSATKPPTVTLPDIPACGDEGKETVVFSFPREAFASSSALTFRPAKRARALHDVDGPGTGSLSCKKRRLRLHLVTSRLSQPYSWPATHILNRESSDDSPVLSRFLKFATVGMLKKAGHQSALVRKAAILNRVRIGVRQAAVLRGHTVIAGMAARGNSLSHGLQLVTTPNSSTGARFPGLSPNPYDHPMPPAWRPHTTVFNSSLLGSSPLDRSSSSSNTSNSDGTTPSPTNSPPRAPPPPLRPGPPASLSDILHQVEEEDEEVAFPSPDLETRYADLSDDDLDDVYADFGVLFGSPDNGTTSSETAGGDHFYEEYLDELDGIRWVA
ncbi:hypothetical protein F4677DRAFT_395899 [Hypoxylon crocopeplum]|nr:hypothetical protein F4677DRAFT_395899 [Hypoxylon crocopeplum]